MSPTNVKEKGLDSLIVASLMGIGNAADGSDSLK